MRVSGSDKWRWIRDGEAVRMDPLDEGAVNVLDPDHWESHLKDLLGTRPDPAELGTGVIMTASEAEASSLAWGEEELLSTLVVLGVGTTMCEPEADPDLGISLGLVTKVLVGQRLCADSSRAGRNATDDLGEVRGSWR